MRETVVVCLWSKVHFTRPWKRNKGYYSRHNVNHSKEANNDKTIGVILFIFLALVNLIITLLSEVKMGVISVESVIVNLA